MTLVTRRLNNRTEICTTDDASRSRMFSAGLVYDGESIGLNAG